MKSYVLSMEMPPSMGGSASEVQRPILDEDPDMRIRTEPIEDAPGLTARDPEMIPTGDVVTTESNQENPSESVVTTEPEPSRIEASKKKNGGGKKGGKGKGKGGGGGQNNGGGKQGGKGNDEWSDLEKVQTALDDWRGERIDTDAAIAEQRAKEDGEVPSMEMERLQKRKEILEKRISKGDAKVNLEALKNNVDQLEMSKIELLKQLQPLGENVPRNLLYRKEELDVQVERAKREYAEALSAFLRDHKDVKFSDSTRDGIQMAPEYVNLDSPKADEPKIVRATKNFFTRIGATLGSMFGMSGGFLQTLWKSWNAHVDKPNTLFGGQKLKDFFLEEQKKKK